MRNRPDISYLTLLGLSLTVVIAMQKSDNCEDSVRFKLSDSEGHHICYLSVDAIRDAFLAVSQDQSSFVFDYNTPAHTALTSSLKALIDVKGLCYARVLPIEADLDGKALRDIAPYFTGLIVPSSSVVYSLFSKHSYPIRANALCAYFCLSSFPVRAGPVSVILI
jgi:hypothetical protein